MTRNRVLDRIADMGANPNVTVVEIDEYVDACIRFLNEELAGADIANDIFEIEAARQDALIAKYSRTVQP